MRDPRPSRLRADKRQAILRAARHVFGQVGYLAASIEVIAARAAVSTRTIYNHFDNKEQLFATVLTESATQVAMAREALIERHLGQVTDLEPALVALATEWVRPDPEFADHFAIVRRLRSESERFPVELRAAWRAAGPLRARRVLAARLAALAGEGLLVVPDSEASARHLLALITDPTANGIEYGAAVSESEIDRLARTGVHVFLYGYLPR